MDVTYEPIIAFFLPCGRSISAIDNVWGNSFCLISTTVLMNLNLSNRVIIYRNVGRYFYEMMLLEKIVENNSK
ncbi:hypothetical protein PU02_0279 [Bartonella ancashensis]|uniref:Uncharacterized protein n=1 Tax=Bartonella ancashensis TaxID=1318743 RepID=A0A0M4LHQ2_9HYPH|nr:hypothetical protein PU02_0279 [Bartonella ancashensis]